MPDNKQQQGAWLWSINPLSLMLWPLSLLFCLLVRIRFQLYRRGLLRSERVAVPVIVVGNISLGGNGKTPVVQLLVKLLASQGYTPGVLTRGYRSDFEHQTTLLSDGKTSDRAGDEANMLSELCACPIAVGADRVKSARQLIEQFPQLDCLVTDDGLQHYALARDIEVVVQRKKAYGNGYCLPAGPLREPLSRIKRTDLLIDRDGGDIAERFGPCWNLVRPDLRRDLSEFSGQKIRALAGIGFPQLFFEALRAEGLDVESHAYADHETYSVRDIEPLCDAPLLVTHKDAVKLRSFATDNIWVVPLELTLSDDLQYRLRSLIESKLHG